MGTRARATSRLRRRLLPTAAAVLLATGCGSVSGVGVAPPPTASAQASVGSDVQSGVTDYLAYVGGTAAAADPAKRPIAIGWVNDDGTANGAPEATRAAQAAVDYVNTALGGIGGRPLVLKTCTMAGAEEAGRRCGQQLLGDPSVAGIAFGNVVVGDQSFNAVVAGKKPVLVGVAIGPSVSTAKNTYVVFGDLTHVFGPWGSYARDVLHARTAALLYTNTAGDKVSAAAIRKGLETAGLLVKAVALDPEATDMLGPITAGGGGAADVIVPVSSGQGCVRIAKALAKLGSDKPVVATPICLSPDVAQGLGGDLPRWVYGVAQTLPTDASAPDAKAYRDASSGVGLAPADQGKVWAGVSWSLVLTYAKVMNAAGPERITPGAVAAQLAAFHGPVVMGAPEVTCGKYEEAPAVCNDQARFYLYRGKGSFEGQTGWLRPPA